MCLTSLELEGCKYTWIVCNTHGDTQCNDRKYRYNPPDEPLPLDIMAEPPEEGEEGELNGP